MLQADAARPACVDSRRKMEKSQKCRWGREGHDAHIGGHEDSGSRKSHQKGKRMMFDAAHMIQSHTKPKCKMENPV